MKQVSFRSFLVLAALLFGVPPADAQLNSTEVTASLTAVLPESLTVTLSAGAASFSLTSGSATNAGTPTLTATTTWTLAVTRTAISLHGYFTTATAALVHTAAGNTVDIPSSRVEVSVNGGAAAAFDQTVAFGGAAAGRQLFTQAITIPTSSGTRNDTLALNINLAGYTLPADTYTGTLRIRAQGTP